MDLAGRQKAGKLGWFRKRAVSVLGQDPWNGPFLR